MIRVLLASASPRRRALLRAAGFKVRCLSPQLNESRKKGEGPRTYVRRLALAKADWGMARARKGELVVAADTAVVQGKQILGKPAGPKDHDRKLRILSGRSHEVLTALVVFLGGKRQVKVCRSRVKFRKLSMAERRAYIQSGEGRGAAGGYKIQGPLSGLLIQSVQGSFSSVVGFPLEAFEKQLRKICDLEFALWNCRS